MEKRDLYPELCGKIREKYRTQEAFARVIGMNPSTLSSKLSGRSQWTFIEVARVCAALDISMADAPGYFNIFLHKVLQGCNEMNMYNL